jgi:hypothetical protein
MPGNGIRFQKRGLILCGREKEPGSHFYMCRAEHRGNYRNLLTYTLDHPPYVALEVVSLRLALLVQALLIQALLVKALLVKTALIKTIIRLCKKLSIVFVRCPRNIMELRSHDTS